MLTEMSNLYKADKQPNTTDMLLYLDWIEEVSQIRVPKLEM
jgi:hypothetical protein